MKKYGSIALTALLAACGGGGGASVSTSKADKPATVAEAKADLAGSLTALSFTGGFGSMFGGAGKPERALAPVSKLVNKIVAQQDENANEEADDEGGDGLGDLCGGGEPTITENSITCDCQGGGSISISGDIPTGQSEDSASGSGTVKMEAKDCLQSNGEGENSLADGVIEISFTIDGTNFSVDLSIDGVFEDTNADGTVEFGLIADNLQQGIDSTVDSEGYQAALAEYQEDPTASEMPEADDYFTSTMTIDGAIDYTDAEAACSNGVYVFKTITALQGGGACGYKAGELEVNGVTYAFAESEVTLGGGLDGTIDCAELQDNTCEE